jgi:hyperosmotically inducible periplasmic protein
MRALAAWVTGAIMVMGGVASAQMEAPRFSAASSGDSERAKMLEAQLHKDTVLSDDAITVTVTGKRVRLAGAVDNDDERRHAEELVWQTDPTLVVENLLTVPQPQASTAAGRAVDKAVVETKEAAHKADNAVNEAGDMITDGWITSKVKTQLMGADGVHASAINVDTADHVVTLRGTVRSQAERARVLQIARTTRGVDKVVDEMKLRK